MIRIVLHNCLWVSARNNHGIPWKKFSVSCTVCSDTLSDMMANYMCMCCSGTGQGVVWIGWLCLGNKCVLLCTLSFLHCSAEHLGRSPLSVSRHLPVPTWWWQWLWCVHLRLWQCPASRERLGEVGEDKASWPSHQVQCAWHSGLPTTRGGWGK